MKRQKITKVRKRDGAISDFNKKKIQNAILKCLNATGNPDKDIANDLTKKVVTKLKLKGDATIPTVEEVQDMVEQVLFEEGYGDVARAYISYRNMRANVRRAREIIGVPLDEIKVSVNAAEVLKQRYLIEDKDGNVETPSHMFKRVAMAVAAADLLYDDDTDIQTTEDKFYNMMVNSEFLPNSPTLMNAGTSLGNLAACFVIPVEDSVEDIFEAVKYSVIISKSGGGVGYNFSRLRPEGDVVKSTNGVASGPISFMRVFDVATDVIKQGGRRRGAQMGLLHCLSGGTMINTLQGPVKIKNLVGKRPYVYAADYNTGLVRIVQADRVFISDVNRKMVRVWIDNQSYLDCTPDHRFMLSNGKYKEAKDLLLGDSLMAFHTYISPTSKNKKNIRWQKMIGITGNRKTIPEHVAVARDILGIEVDYNNTIHHKDENSLNNLPSNIEGLTRSEHGKKHSAILVEHRDRIANERKGKSLEEVYGKEKAAEWKQNMSEARKGRITWNKGLKGEEYTKHYTEFKNQYSNHKVIMVEEIGIAKKVYDISLPKYHNFSANGIFVHNCSHPDIMKFITCKQRDGSLANFNISVAITDEFMNAVENDEPFELKHPKTQQVTQKVSARYLFDSIVANAWATGDPGIVYIDHINKSNPTPYIGDIESVNPCGEQPLLPYESCNLGSINLAKHIKNGKVDWDKLRSTTDKAVHFLDNVIDICKYPLPEIDHMAKANRKIGLGVMGWADMLFELGIPYDSEKAIYLAREVMLSINNWTYLTSIKLGKIRGSFPNFEKSIYFYREVAMRNATRTTIAPTGSIGIIANASSGIEPVFAFAYTRNVAESLGTTLFEVNPVFERVARERGFYSEELMIEVSKKGSIQNIAGISEDIKKVFVTALDIDPEWHVKMQAAFQKYTDNAVSKTVNLPQNATLDDVKKIYLMAYNENCKGITIYRYGSKSNQVLSIEE